MQAQASNRKLRILVTGATGMLGSTLVKQLQPKHEVFSTSTVGGLDYFENYMKFDLLQDDYSELISWSKPDVIIHSAALTNGNVCQNNPEMALRINGLSSFKLLTAVGSACRIIYISTDAVFPHWINMAKEDDNVFPENTYGKSKELGEYFLIQQGLNFTVVRTTIVGFNQRPDKKGFVEWIIESAQTNKHIQLFNDVLFTPITCTQLSTELEYIMQSSSFKNEIIHLAGSEAISKYEFGAKLLESISVSDKYVSKGNIFAFDKRAKRSTDQSLNCSKYMSATNRQLPNLDQCVKQLSKEYNER